MSDSNVTTALLSALTPDDVSRYLASRGWQLEHRDPGIKEVWQLPSAGGPQGRIMLPLATDYADFSRRFHEAFQALGAIYDCAPGVLAGRVAAARQPATPTKITVGCGAMTDLAIPLLAGLEGVLDHAAGNLEYYSEHGSDDTAAEDLRRLIELIANAMQAIASDITDAIDANPAVTAQDAVATLRARATALAADSGKWYDPRSGWGEDD